MRNCLDEQEYRPDERCADEKAEDDDDPFQQASHVRYDLLRRIVCVLFSVIDGG